MPDLGNDIPQPFSVRRRGREWEVVVLPLLPQAKPTLVAESPNESVAETIAEECNAAAVAYSKAVIARAKRWQATPKAKAVRESKEPRAVREAEAKAIPGSEATARKMGDREKVLRQILALPAVKKAIKDGELSVQTLKKCSYSRLLRRQKQLLGNMGLRNGGAESHAESFVAVAIPNEVTAS